MVFKVGRISRIKTQNNKYSAKKIFIKYAYFVGGVSISIKFIYKQQGYKTQENKKQEDKTTT